MSIEATLKTRSNRSCELCSATDNLNVFSVPPDGENNSDKAVLLCGNCNEQIIGESEIDVNHWHCLNDSMWSQVPAVQVMAFRMLTKLSSEGWAQDLLDMLYLEEDVKAWAESGITASDGDEVTVDSNGAILVAGDNVTLIKDLVVKGANFTAKRGTAVRNISLTSNPEHIEGRVNGTRIVLLTCYLKKS